MCCNSSVLDCRSHQSASSAIARTGSGLRSGAIRSAWMAPAPSHRARGSVVQNGVVTGGKPSSGGLASLEVARSVADAATDRPNLEYVSAGVSSSRALSTYQSRFAWVIHCSGQPDPGVGVARAAVNRFSRQQRSGPRQAVEVTQHVPTRQRGAGRAGSFGVGNRLVVTIHRRRVSAFRANSAGEGGGGRLVPR